MKVPLPRAWARRVKIELDTAQDALINRWTVLAQPLPERPIIVLGHQKSGTSAIAALLGRATGLSVAIDLRRDFGRLEVLDVFHGRTPVERFIERNAVRFRSAVIKDPNLTLIYPQLRSVFPQANFVYLERDPRDVIRSVFDRLGLSGHLERLSEEQRAALPFAWREALTGERLGRARENPVEALAERLALFGDQYVQHASDLLMLQYSDFMKDRAGAIEDLARRLSLRVIEDVRPSVTEQHQRRGKNRHLPWSEFFSSQNLARIEEICRAQIER